MFKVNKLLLCLLFFVPFFLSCKRDSRIYYRGLLTDTSQLWHVDKRFLRKDTAYFLNAISELDSLNFPELALKAYELSEVTGFGWFLTDPRDSSTFSEEDPVNQFLKRNIINGFKEYANSKLFMKQTQTILMHRYFHFTSKRLLDENDLQDVHMFLDDCADSILVVNYY